MKNNKELRVICKNGRYKLCLCVEDSDGDIISVIADDVNMGFRSEEEFDEFSIALDKAYDKPVIHINRMNEKIFWKVE